MTLCLLRIGAREKMSRRRMGEGVYLNTDFISERIDSADPIA